MAACSDSSAVWKFPLTKYGLTSAPAFIQAHSRKLESVPPENANEALGRSDRYPRRPSNDPSMISQKPSLFQSLIDVVYQILRILYTYAEPEESVAEPVIEQVLALIVLSQEYY